MLQFRRVSESKCLPSSENHNKVHTTSYDETNPQHKSRRKKKQRQKEAEEKKNTLRKYCGRKVVVYIHLFALFNRELMLNSAVSSIFFSPSTIRQRRLEFTPLEINRSCRWKRIKCCNFNFGAKSTKLPNQTHWAREAVHRHFA